jgi:hypothetical protein
MLGLIDTLQDQSIRILAGQGIVPSGVRVLRRWSQHGDPQRNKLGRELVHVCPAIHMKGEMMEPWGVTVIGL